MSAETVLIVIDDLGALLLFSTQPFYPAYAHAADWGWSALDDQRLGGLLMWVPGSIAYLVAMALMLQRLLGSAAPGSRTGIAHHRKLPRA